ncbi:tetratricopeptide repeat protein [Veronia pacifica]|uniref:Tetratrico peptide repeat group 5 domain-containing protein n=1 Tax=Veronia pacifica TaxID=1080227 RepID=A0A1C3E7J9_9GAMM|nr:tetratricopeptide repeat protein [Veronia pacifica]ODA29225.1 hypothetical protein A8L45_22485 [Veronia pacifica]
MNNIVEQAITLYRDGQSNEAVGLLSGYLTDPEWGSLAHFHTAFAYDRQGDEKKAIPHYRQALLGSLNRKDRFDALLGLGSSLRCLGEYVAATETFELLLSEYPDSQSAQPFYAMCLYNTGRGKEACQLLMKLLLATTDNQEIKAYQAALALYAEDLDQTWID